MCVGFLNRNNSKTREAILKTEDASLTSDVKQDSNKV